MSLASSCARLAMAIAACLTIACGGDEDDGIVNTCDEYAELVCQLACDCTEGEGCAINQEGGFTVSFDSSGDCRGFFALGCEEDDPEIEACAAAIEGAECIELDDGTLALEDPGECE